MAKNSENFVQRLVTRIDGLQRRHRALGFTYGVVKKYSDDGSGPRAALLTYYGFSSLFPLLLVATSVVDFISQHNGHLRTRLLSYATSYFPVVGQQLQQNIHDSHKTGIALIVGLLITLYGTHGVADEIRTSLDNAWATPHGKRSSFAKGLLKSFALLFGVSIGLILTTALASFATAELGHSLVFRIVPLLINAILLYLIFMYTFIVGTSHRQPRRNLRFGAITGVTGLLILQTLGGYLITHELRNTAGVYGQFALVLAILFWLYLLAQVFTYAVEVTVVQTYKLWPRSLTGKDMTPADKKVLELYPKR